MFAGVPFYPSMCLSFSGFVSERRSTASLASTPVFLAGSARSLWYIICLSFFVIAERVSA